MALKSETQLSPCIDGGNAINTNDVEKPSSDDLEDGEIFDDDEEEESETQQVSYEAAELTQQSNNSVSNDQEKQNDTSQVENNDETKTLAKTKLVAAVKDKKESDNGLSSSWKNSKDKHSSKGNFNDENSSAGANFSNKEVKKNKEKKKKKRRLRDDDEGCGGDDEHRHKDKKARKSDDSKEQTGGDGRNDKMMAVGGDASNSEDECDEDEMLNVRGASPTPIHHRLDHFGEDDYYDDEEDDSDDDDVDEDMSGDEDGKKLFRSHLDRAARRERLAARGKRRGRLSGRELLRKKKSFDDGDTCIFYMQGKCHKGSDCPYSHDVMPAKKLEVCKFYLMDCCNKKDKCSYMHGEFPCKYYHLGLKCYADKNCKFSHGKLSEIMKQVLYKTFGPPRNKKNVSKRKGDDGPPRRRGVGRGDNKEGGNKVGEKKIPSLFDIKVSIPDELKMHTDSDGDGNHTPMPSPPPPANQRQFNDFAMGADGSPLNNENNNNNQGNPDNQMAMNKRNHLSGNRESRKERKKNENRSRRGDRDRNREERRRNRRQQREAMMNNDNWGSGDDYHGDNQDEHDGYDDDDDGDDDRNNFRRNQFDNDNRNVDGNIGGFPFGSNNLFNSGGDSDERVFIFNQQLQILQAQMQMLVRNNSNLNKNNSNDNFNSDNSDNNSCDNNNISRSLTQLQTPNNLFEMMSNAMASSTVTSINTQENSNSDSIMSTGNVGDSSSSNNNFSSLSQQIGDENNINNNNNNNEEMFPAHLPKKQRELFMRIKQQQRQASDTVQQDELNSSNSNSSTSNLGDNQQQSNAIENKNLSEENNSNTSSMLINNSSNVKNDYNNVNDGENKLNSSLQSSQENETNDDQEDWYSSDEDDEREENKLSQTPATSITNTSGTNTSSISAILQNLVKLNNSSSSSSSISSNNNFGNNNNNKNSSVDGNLLSSFVMSSASSSSQISNNSISAPSETPSQLMQHNHLVSSSNVVGPANTNNNNNNCNNINAGTDISSGNISSVDFDVNKVSELLSKVKQHFQTSEKKARDPRLRASDIATSSMNVNASSNTLVFNSTDNLAASFSGANKTNVRSNSGSENNAELNTALSSSGNSSQKVIDLCNLPFKPAPEHSAANEIDASINSHIPIQYKLIPVIVPKPDYSSIPLNSKVGAADPRLRKTLRLSDETGSAGNVSSRDPRHRLIDDINRPKTSVASNVTSLSQIADPRQRARAAAAAANAQQPLDENNVQLPPSLMLSPQQTRSSFGMMPQQPIGTGDMMCPPTPRIDDDLPNQNMPPYMPLQIAVSRPTDPRQRHGSQMNQSSMSMNSPPMMSNNPINTLMNNPVFDPMVSLNNVSNNTIRPTLQPNMNLFNRNPQMIDNMNSNDPRNRNNNNSSNNNNNNNMPPNLVFPNNTIGRSNDLPSSNNRGQFNFK